MNHDFNHSIADFPKWAGVVGETVLPAKIDGPVNRLNEPGNQCQLLCSCDAAGECGAPGAPAEVFAPRFRKDEAARTRLRLCQSCFEKSAKLRPTMWLVSN